MFATKPISNQYLIIRYLKFLTPPAEGSTQENQIQEIVTLLDLPEDQELTEDQLGIIINIYRDWLLFKISEEPYNWYLAKAVDKSPNNYTPATEEELEIINPVISVLLNLCRTRKLDETQKRLLRIAALEPNIGQFEPQPKSTQQQPQQAQLPDNVSDSQVIKEEETEVREVTINQEAQVNNGAVVDLLTNVLAKIDTLNSKIDNLNNQVEVQNKEIKNLQERIEEFEVSIINEVRGQRDILRELSNNRRAESPTPAPTPRSDEEVIISPFTGQPVVRKRLFPAQPIEEPATHITKCSEVPTVNKPEEVNNSESDVEPEPAAIVLNESVAVNPNVEQPIIESTIIEPVAAAEEPETIVSQELAAKSADESEEPTVGPTQVASLAAQLAKLGKQYPDKISALFKRLKGQYGEAVTKAAILSCVDLSPADGWTETKLTAYQSAIESVFPGWMASLSGVDSPDPIDPTPDEPATRGTKCSEPVVAPTEEAINNGGTEPVKKWYSCITLSDEAFERLSIGFGKAIKFESFDRVEIEFIGRSGTEVQRLNKPATEDLGIDWWAIANHDENITNDLLDVLREYMSKGLGETESYLLSLAAYSPNELADRLQAIAMPETDRKGKRLDYTPRLAKFRQIEAAATKLVQLLNERRFVEAIGQLYGWSNEHTQQFLSEANDLITSKGRYQFFTKMEAVFQHVKAHRQ